MSTIEIASTDVPPLTAETTWPFAKRWLFAFTVVFFVLVNWWFPWAYLPLLDKVGEWLNKMWDAIVVPVATHVFHVTVRLDPTGSGDTTYNYVFYTMVLAFALAVGLIFAALDRRRAHYERLRDYFRVYLRFALGAAMIGYGTIKVIQSQFPPPNLDRLTEPFGAASPMGLLWTFMGASRAYNFLTGSAELLGGLLLATRRTALLGALLSAAAMANIVALNFCYDVPVKLYSTQLLLEALIIAAPDTRRLLATLLRKEQPLFRRTWAARTAFAIGVLFAGAITFAGLQQAQNNVTARAVRSPLRGIWSVDELSDNGASRPPLTTDLSRWRRVIFDGPRLAYIQQMSDARFRYRIQLDEKARTVKLTDWENPKASMNLTYVRADTRTLLLDTTVDGHRLHAVCHLSDAAMKPLLTTRGFHWISEVPFNR